MDPPPLIQLQALNLLGVDYGEKVIGLAHFAPGSDPFPLAHGRLGPSLQVPQIQALLQHIDEFERDVVVMGIPLSQGKFTPMSLRVFEFGKQLIQERPSLLLFWQDESLSSFEADQRLQQTGKPASERKQSIDAVSAQVILEDFWARVNTHSNARPESSVQIF